MDSDAPEIEITIKVENPYFLKLHIDTSKVPSMAYAIAVLDKALRTLKNEESNAAGIAFANRLAQEQQDEQVRQALLNRRKM